MSRFYQDNEDELEIRIRDNVRHGRVSPQPVIQPEHRYRSVRPLYEHGSSSYLVPTASPGLRRSLSTGARTPPPPPTPAPVIINNIQRDRSRDRSRDRRSSNSPLYDSDDYSEEEYYGRGSQRRRRSHSHSRHQSFSRSQIYAPQALVPAAPQRDPRDEYELQRTRQELEEYRRLHSQEEYELEKSRRELEKIRIRSSKEDYELERTRRELAAYKAAEEREEEEKRIKEELELQRLKAEKKAADEKAKLKKESDAAIEKYKIEEAEKAAKEKKEKEEREKEYQRRFEEDLRKNGMDERQISIMLKKDMGVDPNRPTYTRMSRRHLSIETLNRYRIDYEFDQVIYHTSRLRIKS